MNFYQTIFGEHIDLGLVRGSLKLFVEALIRNTGEIIAGTSELTRRDFEAQVREYIHVQYPEPASYDLVLNSEVGTIFRDCFYRIFIQDVTKGDKDQEKELIHWLTFHPNRLVFDAALGDLAVIVRATRAVKYPTCLGWQEALVNGSLQFSAEQMFHLFSELRRIPGQTKLRNSGNTGGFSVRERRLRKVIAAVTHAVIAAKSIGDEEAVMGKIRSYLGLCLAEVYQVRNALALDRMTNTVFGDILQASADPLDKNIEVSEHARQVHQDWIKSLAFLETTESDILEIKGCK